MAEGGGSVDPAPSQEPTDWRPRVQQMAQTIGNYLRQASRYDKVTLEYEIAEYRSRREHHRPSRTEESAGEPPMWEMEDLPSDIPEERRRFLRQLDTYVRSLLRDYPPEAREYFVVCVSSAAPPEVREGVQIEIRCELGVKCPGELDRLYPAAQYSEQQLLEALTVWQPPDTGLTFTLAGTIDTEQEDVRELELNVELDMEDLSLPGTVILLTCQCQGAEPVQITSARLSGSQKEGVAINRCTHLFDTIFEQVSDTDVMVQLGPAHLLARLTVEPTERPGYFLLRFPGAGGCTQCNDGLFSAQRVRKAVASLPGLREGKRTQSGASIETTDRNDHLLINIDYVPYIPDIDWPQSDYKSRQQYRGFTSPETVEEVSCSKASLVTKGFRGSPDENDQYRISFSEQEATLLPLLHPTHQQALVILKKLKVLVLGWRLREVKSYHLKTCVMWVAEESAELDLWRLILAVVGRLQEAVRSGNLPCYFQPDINLLAPLDHHQLRHLQTCVDLMSKTLHSTLNLLVHRESELIHLNYDGKDRPLTFPAEMSVGLFRSFSRSLRCSSVIPPSDRNFVQLVTAVALSDECELPLRPARTQSGTEYWVLDLSWFCHPDRRRRYLYGMEELDIWLGKLSRDPELRDRIQREYNIRAELLRPLDQLSDGQLAELYCTGAAWEAI